MIFCDIKAAKMFNSNGYFNISLVFLHQRQLNNWHFVLFFAIILPLLKNFYISFKFVCKKNSLTLFSFSAFYECKIVLYLIQFLVNFTSQILFSEERKNNNYITYVFSF